MIIMHNFLHFLPPQPGENEQNFNPIRVEKYIEIIFNSPEYIFQATFSFMGHYGVQLFLFLSAYGLSVKYINSDIKYFTYLKKRIFKILLFDCDFSIFHDQIIFVAVAEIFIESQCSTSNDGITNVNLNTACYG